MRRPEPLTFKECNSKDFAWINKLIGTYPVGDNRKNQYHKSKYFSIETYLPESKIKSYLDFIQIRGLVHYIYILHNKDLKGDGKPCEPHWHLLLEFDKGLTCKSVCNAFNLCAVHNKDPTFSEVRSSVQYFEAGDSIPFYLFHLTSGAIAKGKHIYDFSECVSDDLDYWLSFGKITTSGRMEQMFDDMFNGLSPLEMVKRYGRDYVINYRAYKEFFDLYIYNELKDKNLR